MINKPELNTKSVMIWSQRVRRFFIKLPQNILLRYNVLIEISIVVIGGLFAGYLLMSFILNHSADRTNDTTYKSSVELSTDTIDQLSSWIESRENMRQEQDSILSRSLFSK